MKKLNYVVEELKGLNYDFKVIERVNHNLRNTLYREYISFEHDEDDLLYKINLKDLLKFLVIADKIPSAEKIFDSALNAIAEIKEELLLERYDNMEELFIEKMGRAPKLLKEVKIAAALADITSSEAVDMFNVKNVNALKKKGMPIMTAFMFIFKAPFYSKSDILRLSKKDISRMARSRTSSGHRSFYKYCYNMEGLEGPFKAEEIIKEYGITYVPYTFEPLKEIFYEFNTSIKETAIMMAESISYIHKIKNNRLFIDTMKKQGYSLAEIVEFSKCSYDLGDLLTKHDLKDHAIKLNNELIGIMAWNDPKQILLGLYTSCCQRFDQQGESSMLFGLLSEHSGFLKIQRDNKIIGQAWVWEFDKNTLVLDNIELANCRNVDQFHDLLYVWAKKSPYKNIQLGLGYSDMTLGEPMTEEEIEDYSIEKSHAYTEKVVYYFEHEEEEVYTDADEERNWIKKDGKVLF